MNLSVTILTKNSSRYLNEVLESLTCFDEVLIYDNGSKDNTLEIASRFPNVVIQTGPFLGFGETHNLVSSMAKNDWILSLDSDEVLTEGLLREIKNLKLERGTVYAIPRHNEYQKRWVKGCGWHPDSPKRIYNRKDTQFSTSKVHESIISKNMKVIELKSYFRHYSYDSINEFIQKMQHYSDLFAEDKAGKVSSSPCKAALHGFWTFFKSYILKRGFLDGYDGYLISSYNAHTAFYKYMKLYERNLKLQPSQEACDVRKKKEVL